MKTRTIFTLIKELFYEVNWLAWKRKRLAKKEFEIEQLAIIKGHVYNGELRSLRFKQNQLGREIAKIDKRLGILPAGVSTNGEEEEEPEKIGSSKTKTERKVHLKTS